MHMLLAVLVGKIIRLTSLGVGLGAGGTWPGEIAGKLAPRLLTHLLHQLEGIIIIAGTNGKTTTALLVKQILSSQGIAVVHNESGANLLNGLVSTLIQECDLKGRITGKFGVFEVDENSLPAVISNFQFPISKDKKNIIVLLNLFRDQLDRYGEVDIIAEKWEKALTLLPKESIVILNADDPQVAYLGKSLSAKVKFFGVNDPKKYLPEMEHATDSTFCLHCGNRLDYEGIYYSHIGVWECKKCGHKRPKLDLSSWKSPLLGFYNQYNTLAAVSVAKAFHINTKIINSALDNFSPAFGRQENFKFLEKNIMLVLSKNPTGFNESMRTVLAQGARHILFVLNDRVPDGKDVSWIWDVDFEMIPSGTNIFVSGDRVYDMALRIKYADKSLKSRLHQGYGGQAKVKSSRHSGIHDAVVTHPPTGGSQTASGQNYKLKLKIKKKLSNDLIVEPDLKKAIYQGLDQVVRDETLYILPTYSAMLETRKIILGKKIL